MNQLRFEPHAVAGANSKRPRICLVSPRGPLYRHRTGIWKKSLRYAPLTLTTLASLIPPELDAEVRLVDEGIHDIDPELDADLVGISAITGTAPRSYELADHFRRRGLPVVLGGVHPTLMPDEAARHADAVVVGYAEQSWPELLHDWLGDRLRDRYVQQPGLSLANLPPPRRDLLPAGEYTTMHTFEATRGCVHACEFCVVPTAWGRPRQKPIGDVVADIRDTRARRLIFLDLNLIADVEYARGLFSALIPLKLSWGGLATTAIASDPDLLDLAARSGCRALLLGFESLSASSLVETRKAFNLRQDYHEVVRALHARNIAIMGCFVFGFDHDTRETFEATVDFVLEANIDLPRYAILTPFPGTALHQRLAGAGRILTDDWSLYDGQHVVFQPVGMAPLQLLQGTEAAWKRTYSFRSIARRLAGSRTLLPVALAANLGYRFYAYNLHKFYNCDWSMGLGNVPLRVGSS
ncbi:MAG TPA: radical SAM protein [Chloroflexota bacterium]